jgi:hypothetical protein
MADITITATDVRPLPGAAVRRFDAGGTCYAGEAVYIADDGDVERADADGSLSVIAIGIVVADNDGGTAFASGDRVDVVTHGPVTGYSSLTPGLPQYVSGTAGQMTQTPADLGAGTYEAIVGMAEAASIIYVNPDLVSALGTAKS